MRTCKICKTRFEANPFNTMQSWCSPECGSKLALKNLEKAKAKEQKQANQANYKAKKEFRASDKTALKSDAQALVNKYSRKRDELENGVRCCTCGTTTAKMDGGHFLPTSTFSPIRYNTNQIHQQCYRCNVFGRGERAKYTIFMTEKYGADYVAYLNSFENTMRRYDVAYYQKLIRVVTKRLKQVETKLKEINR